MACGTGGGGGGGGNGVLMSLPLLPPGPGDCPGTPPGARTSLCWSAVDGCSSSALFGRIKVPLTHRAAITGTCGSGAIGECAC